MSENSSVQLSVGSIIHMDGANGTKGIWISQALQFDDIYLTESEDFWQEQNLDCDKQLFELLVSEESPASEGLLFKQTTESTEKFLIDEASTRDQSPCIAEMSFGEILPSEVTDELLMPDKLTCFTDTYIDKLLMTKIVMIDAPTSSTGMLSEQTTESTEKFLIDEASTRDQSPCIAEMSFGEILPSEVADEGSEEICEIEMIDAQASLTGMFIEQTLPSEVTDEASEGMYEIEMIDQSACLTDMQPVGSAYQKVNKTSFTSDIGSTQGSSVQKVPQDIPPQYIPTLQGKLESQYTTIEEFKANPKHACDNTKMFVRCSNDKEKKKLCCPFCLRCFSKLARHLATMHKKELDVKKFVNLPKGSKERRFIQDSLRKAGTFIWNSDIELNKNELIPSRRPKVNTVQEAIRWTTCPYCRGSYTKNNLRHHVAECKVKIQSNLVKGDQRILTKLATIVEARIHDNASTRLVNVMGFMRDDEIVRLVKFDWLLIVFGNKMCCKYTPHYQENMIRSRLRLTGRVLTEIKKIDPNVTDFASIYHVERYNSLVSAIRNIGRFDLNTSEFDAPAMASFAVTFIKIIGKYLSAEYIRLRDRDNKVETEDFLAYMDTDIDISINKLVAETQAKMRRRKQENIPTMEDVKKLIRHINFERNLCFEKLSETYSYDNWFKLAELSMAWIIVFNRRRIGEVQNILVDEFLGRQSIDDDSNEQMLATLTADAKSVAKKFKRMKIRGKKGRTVPVLLKPAIDKSIQLLLDNRQMAGVSIDNQFLFELPSSSTLRIRVVDACQVLRKLSISCGANNPSSLRGTNLRKHMATTCVSLELSDALVAEVAEFMGHAEKIHREYYRQNTIDREVVQMARLLELAAGKCDSYSDDEDDEIGNGGFINGDRGSTDGANSGTMNVLTETADDEMIFEPSDNCITLDKSQHSLPIKIAGGEVHIGAEKKKCSRVRWSEEEISCVKEVFADHFKNRTLPVEDEIENQKGDNAILRSRTWQQIKAYINNNQRKKGTRK